MTPAATDERTLVCFNCHKPIRLSRSAGTNLGYAAKGHRIWVHPHDTSDGGRFPCLPSMHMRWTLDWRLRATPWHEARLRIAIEQATASSRVVQ